MMQALRYAPEQPYWRAPPQGPAKTIYTGPAMLAAVTDAGGQVVGCHVTWINPDRPGEKISLKDPGTGDLLPSKKLRGTKRKGAIRLIEPKDFTRLVIGEGIETVLSVYEAERSSMIAASTAYWAAIDLGHLGGKPRKSIPHPTLKTDQGKPQTVGGPWPELQPDRDLDVPDQVTQIVLLGDGDSEPFATEMALRRAAARWHKQGRTIKVAWAPAGQDMNDVLDEAGTAGVQDILRDAKPFPPLPVAAPAKSKKRKRTARSEEGSGANVADASGGDAETKSKRRVPQCDRAVADLDDIELFHTPSGEPYATYVVNGHRENAHCKDLRFKRYLRHRIYRKTGQSIGGQALEGVLGILEGRAIYEGPEFETWIRVGEHDGRLFLDLCDEEWRAVDISKDGWQVTKSVPIKFVRSSAMRPLPEPEPGEPIERLGSFINTASEDDFRLAVGGILQAFRPNVAQPIIVIVGEPGSAKSTGCRVLRSVIDPNMAPLRSPPKEERDLIVSGDNDLFIAIDNISHMPAWLADALCRITSPGSGYAVRRLHTDRDVEVFSGTRPVILNGIANGAERSDMASRALLIHLPAIADKRIEEVAFWREFESELPHILGALLDGVVAALCNFEATKIDHLPRMASFARWVTAAELGLGWEAGSVLRAYERNQAAVFEEAAEADPVVMAIRDRWDRLCASSETGERDAYEAAPAKFLVDLSALVDESVKKSKSWPGGASVLGQRIRRVAPILRRCGFIVDPGKSGGARKIRIVKRREEPR